MKKIPTCFERDWEGDRSRVLPDLVTRGCEWVFAGDGIATQKHDGTACMVEGGVLYKRREQRAGVSGPSENFRLVDHDLTTDKIIGWVPVGDGPEDKWHRQALANTGIEPPDVLPDGTYELVGPKIQGNPEKYEKHTLVRHGHKPYIVPRDYEGMKELLAELDVEGFVFHHPDGRMAKIKARDFGIKRKQAG